jgi:hypothetical protein
MAILFLTPFIVLAIGMFFGRHTQHKTAYDAVGYR